MPQPGSDICFDRNHVQFVRKGSQKKADKSAEDDQRDSISDAASPGRVYRHTTNPRGEPVRHILFGMGNQRADGHAVISQPRGAGGERAIGGLFFRREEPWEFQYRREDEEEKRADKLAALERILSGFEFGLTRQDVRLVIRLIELECVENRATPRNIGYKVELLSPVLSRFTMKGGDFSEFDHNFFASSPRDVRSASTIAEWEKRRADTGEIVGKLQKTPDGFFRYKEKRRGSSSLRREFSNLFGVSLRVFPSEKVSLILARVNLLYDDESAKRLREDVDRFLHPRNIFEDVDIRSGGHERKLCPLDPFRVIKESHFYYIDDGYALSVFPKDERTSVGRNVSRPSMLYAA